MCLELEEDGDRRYLIENFRDDRLKTTMFDFLKKKFFFLKKNATFSKGKMIFSKRKKKNLPKSVFWHLSLCPHRLETVM